MGWILGPLNDMIVVFGVMSNSVQRQYTGSPMPGTANQAGASPEPAEDVASALVRLMRRDLVYAMRFLGESQDLLQRHFEGFILSRLAEDGLTESTHPLIRAVAAGHAALLRDFVFSGVSLSRQLRIADIEQAIGDATALLKVDIWDDLKSHIDLAEKHFRTRMPGVVAMLDADGAPPGHGKPGDGECDAPSVR